MSGALAASPTFQLQPAPQQVALATNYVADFDFLNQYLPDTEAQQFARYGDQSISGFLQVTSSELPTVSDLIKWSEDERRHIKYVQVGTAASANADTATFQVNDTLDPARGSIGLTAGSIAIRVGQNLVIAQNDGSGYNKAIVTAVNTGSAQFTVAFYEAGGLVTAGTGLGNANCTVFIYGSEFGKGQNGMTGSLEANPDIFDNKTVIMKDQYSVNGSDMAQIGWIEVETTQGMGYYWYLLSESETRARFNDYMETKVIEDVPAETGSGAIAATATGQITGTEGVFYTVENRGNVYSGGVPETLSDFDTIIARLDKQGSISENVLFVNRAFGVAIDDMLAAQNSYGTGGTSYGLFNNSKDTALSLSFKGFDRSGYEFYYSAWKYLNDPTMRGDLPSGVVNGLMVPAGKMSVYDQMLGSRAKYPFIHVRYRKSPSEDRRYKSWVIAGDIGGVSNTDLDARTIHFLTDRCACVMGANNFVYFEN